jgi:hypothetical protein
VKSQKHLQADAFYKVDEEEEEVVHIPLPATPLESLPGFDLSAGTSWIYPVNYSFRWVTWVMGCAELSLLCK